MKRICYPVIGTTCNTHTEPNVAKISTPKFSYKSSCVKGRHFRDFWEFQTFLRKFVTWNTLICEFLNVFSREILPRQLFAKVYSEFSIALFKAGRSFNHQKVGLIYSALSELLLFFLKTWHGFSFFCCCWNDNYLLSFFLKMWKHFSFVFNLYILIKSHVFLCKKKV